MTLRKKQRATDFQAWWMSATSMSVQDCMYTARKDCRQLQVMILTIYHYLKMRAWASYLGLLKSNSQLFQRDCRLVILKHRLVDYQKVTMMKSLKTQKIHSFSSYRRINLSRNVNSQLAKDSNLIAVQPLPRNHQSCQRRPLPKTTILRPSNRLSNSYHWPESYQRKKERVLIKLLTAKAATTSFSLRVYLVAQITGLSICRTITNMTSKVVLLKCMELRELRRSSQLIWCMPFISTTLEPKNFLKFRRGISQRRLMV